jgi:transcriptional regulator with XRE-family HTH domain|tara:strand:- start:1257 stop:1532 length:276 start_codon:yes stop_codon:yes gene_type:complete
MRRARTASGLSLRQVAEQMGISAAYLSDLERGRRGWSKQLIDDFETAIGGLPTQLSQTQLLGLTRDQIQRSHDRLEREVVVLKQLLQTLDE